jgi:hypothetical protein
VSRRPAHGLGLLLSTTATACIWLAGLAGATPAHAEPVFAVRTGYSCGQCHVNRTGGGMRTTFGSSYTQTVLPARLLTWRDRGYLLPANPDARFGFGADVRMGYLAVDSDDYDPVSSFEIVQANVYGLVRLVPRRFSLYFDQSLAPGGAASRELFGLLALQKAHGYVKIGKFIPPFGTALPDDDAFIREPMGFSFSAPDTGIEVGFEPGKWSLHAAVVNGNSGTHDEDRTKKFTALANRRFRMGRIGVTGANDLSGGTTTWGGILGGLQFGRFSLLGESTWRRARPDDTPEVMAWAAYAEVNVMIKRGMNIKYSHDWMDPNRDVRTDQRSRDSLGFEYIPYPFVQLRAFLRVKDGPAQIPGARDEQAEVELHLFF